MAQSPASNHPATDIAKESAAGEEDPGAAIPSPSPGDGPASATGRAPCAECGGSGRAESGGRCPACDGLGTIGTGAHGGA